jgi:hypothetical protein
MPVGARYLSVEAQQPQRFANVPGVRAQAILPTVTFPMIDARQTKQLNITAMYGYQLDRSKMTRSGFLQVSIGGQTQAVAVMLMSMKP